MARRATVRPVDGGGAQHGVEHRIAVRVRGDRSEQRNDVDPRLEGERGVPAGGAPESGLGRPVGGPGRLQCGRRLPRRRTTGPLMKCQDRPRPGRPRCSCARPPGPRPGLLRSRRPTRAALPRPCPGAGGRSGRGSRDLQLHHRAGRRGRGARVRAHVARVGSGRRACPVRAGPGRGRHRGGSHELSEHATPRRPVRAVLGGDRRHLVGCVRTWLAASARR